MTATTTAQSERHDGGYRSGAMHPVWTNVAVVVLIGVLVTGALVIGAARVHDNNEQRLLDQRVREVGAVLEAAIPSLQASLSAAAIVAESTNGNPSAFRQVMAPIVGASPKKRFASASLWRLGRPARQIVRIGARPQLTTQSPARAAALFRRATGKKSFVVADLLEGTRRGLGYAFTVPKGASPHYLIYGEQELARTRKAKIGSDSAFADLDYALFFGGRAVPDKLIASSTGGTSLSGRTGSFTADFGDTKLLLVVSPQKDLGGSLLEWLPLILAGFGLLCTLAAALTVWRLSKRRSEAESLAFDNERLYAGQRSVAQTLQHSLLPQTLPEAEGFEFGAIYAPGTEGIDIGGDWYEVVPRDDGSVVVVVGDVSGHGLEAATMMASLRFAILAYAADGDSPATILGKLTHLISVGRDGHFATVLIGIVDPVHHRTTWADAGHPRPLLVTDGASRYVSVPVGPPVGVVAGAIYAEANAELSDEGTLLLYTDGLVERRGETIDVGFERLADAALRVDAEPLADALFSVVRRAIPDGCDDDAALLGIRWRADVGPEPTAFPATPAAVSEARTYVADALDGSAPEVVETVSLLVSELATNSVRHAAAGFTLDIQRRPDRIRVAVSDSGPGNPQVRSPEPVEPSGRGLLIVEALSEDWGYEPTADGAGKTVWFEVAVVPATT